MSKAVLNHLSVEALKVSYPVTVATMTIAGVTLDDMVKLTAILAALLSAGYTAWKWWRDAHRDGHKRARTVDKVTTPADRP